MPSSSCKKKNSFLFFLILSLFIFIPFAFTCLGINRVLLSFPTRRSADLQHEIRRAGMRTGCSLGDFKINRSTKVSSSRVTSLHPPSKFYAMRMHGMELDRKSTRLNSSHGYISYAVFFLQKKK